MKILKKNYLKEIGTHDFGVYQSLVESLIYEMESIKKRLKESHQSSLRTSQTKRLKFLLYMLSFAIFPAFIVLLTFWNDGTWIEYLTYSLIAICGVVWLGFFFKNQREINRKTHEDKRLGEKATLIAFGYALLATEDYFNRAYEVEMGQRISHLLNESEVDRIANKMEELEIDLAVFDEIMGKHDRYNQDPIILKSDSYLQKREISQEYAITYINQQIQLLSVVPD